MINLGLKLMARKTSQNIVIPLATRHSKSQIQYENQQKKTLPPDLLHFREENRAKSEK